MTTLTQKYKILVVDDEPTNLKLLREILRHEYALVFARNGPEMLRYAAEGPDLILLDIMMPDMDGYDACLRLKSQEATRQIPVIFVTAKITPEDEVQGLEVGAVDYLTKPVQAAVVRARVKVHLQLQQARRLIEEQNEKLRQAARLKDDVEQMVRHDLKGPLNAIIGLPELLIYKWKLNSEQAESLKVIESAGFRMLEMINRSHDLYKMEQKSYQLVAVAVNLVLVLQRVLAELQEIVRSRNLLVNLFLNNEPVTKTDLCIISGEELLCHSLLANLLKNGMEASPVRGTLVVHMETRELAVIRIGNQGSVPEEIRANFFDKYVTSGKKRGTGLGTYSAKLNVVTMGGTIELDASKEGETFIEIRLPLFVSGHV